MVPSPFAKRLQSAELGRLSQCFAFYGDHPGLHVDCHSVARPSGQVVCLRISPSVLLVSARAELRRVIAIPPEVKTHVFLSDPELLNELGAIDVTLADGPWWKLIRDLLPDLYAAMSAERDRQRRLETVVPADHQALVEVRRMVALDAAGLPLDTPTGGS